MYAVNLYRDRKITLREASELADASTREMLDLLIEHGIKGNTGLGINTSYIKSSDIITRIKGNVQVKR